MPLKGCFLDEVPTAQEKALQANIEAIKNEAEVKIAEARENADREKMLKALQSKAADVRILYDAYLAEGFTEEQAWELIKPYAACAPISYCV